MGLANSQDTYKQVSSSGVLQSTDFFIHIGDVSYADDWYLRPGDDYEGSWDKWQTWMQPVSSTKAYMTLPGNHEVTCTEATPFVCPANQRNFTAYRHRFRMPCAESGGLANLWYSYDYGLVHFVKINAETDFPGSPSGPGSWLNGGPFGDQLTWLRKDLDAAAANRKNVPWIVVFGHRPWYGSASKCTTCQAAFEPLFQRYGVDLYFSGHVHYYERLWPIKDGAPTQKNYVEPTAPVYIINGCAGNVEGHSHGTQDKAVSAYLNQDDYGFGKLSLVNATTLDWQFFRATDGALTDRATIIKHH